MLTVVPGDGSGHEGGKDGSRSLIDEIVREGARRMLAEALAAEVDAYIAQFTAERDENGRRLVVRNGYHRAAGGADQRGRGRGDRAAGQRQAHRPGHRRAAAVLLGDLAAVGAEDPEDHRGAAAAVSARAVQRRLRARAGPVPGLIRRAVGGGDHPADRDLAGRAARLRRRGTCPAWTTSTCGPMAST